MSESKGRDNPPRAYYNEIDPRAAEWLRNLITAGHIADGDVDSRSIEDVLPSDLEGYTQCHFFAGVGVWSYALRQAGWSDDRPVWTGSCPCQPFSAAGKGDGFADERHLWPAWHHLIRERRPAIVFGEQVASKDADPWIDLVQTDMEALGAAFGAIAFPSAGVGAPHIRDRTYWVADSGGERLNGQHARLRRPAPGRWDSANHVEADGGGEACDLANAERERVRGAKCGADGGSPGGVQGANGQWERVRPDAGPGGGFVGIVADAGQEQRGRRPHVGEPGGKDEAKRIEAAVHDQRCGSAGLMGDTERDGLRIGRRPATDLADESGDGPVRGFWSGADWILCRDEKWRPVEPGTFPLAHGAPARVVRLRAYGNAINAEAAKAWIESYMEAAA